MIHAQQPLPRRPRRPRLPRLVGRLVALSLAAHLLAMIVGFCAAVSALLLSVQLGTALLHVSKLLAVLAACLLISAILAGLFAQSRVPAKNSR